MKTTHFLRAAIVASGAALALNVSPSVSGAQDSRIRDDRLRDEIMSRIMPRIESGRMWDSFAFGDSKRAVIGVTMSNGNRSDTLGVLISEITPGGPADKAGIKEGSRITAINGVNLRLSREDAGDPELEGLGQRRLQRELAKAAPGDEVELRISTGSNSQTFRLKTMSAGELTSSRSNSGPYVGMAGTEKRASLGISLGSTGSSRDTLGLFVSSVVSKGPAEKAGVFEGDRIAAINGVDVRVPREDAEDAQASMARVNRFTRELARLAPGDKLTLRVYGGGRYREVEVTAGNAAELRSNGFMFNFGDGPILSLPRGQIEGFSVPGTVRRASPAIIRRGSGS